MGLDFSKATKQQLFTVISENCPMDYKYKAAFELLKRREKETSRKVSRYKRLAAFSDNTYRFHSGGSKI